MSNSISLISSIVALGLAVLAPAFTAIINNRYQLKMQKTNFKINKLTETCEKFLKLASEQINGAHNSLEFEEASGKLFLYIPSEYHGQLENFINSVNNKTDDVHFKYIEISKLLSEFLEKDTLKTNCKFGHKKKINKT